MGEAGGGWEQLVPERGREIQKGINEGEKGRKLNICSLIQQLSTKHLLSARHGSRCWDMGEHDKLEILPCWSSWQVETHCEHHKHTKKKGNKERLKVGRRGSLGESLESLH